LLGDGLGLSIETASIQLLRQPRLGDPKIFFRCFIANGAHAMLLGFY
jgi:hypothetical protein